MLGTTINIIDQSQIPTMQEAVGEDNSPLFLAASATEKGKEEMAVYSGTDFFTMFGNPNFKKFGQVSIQTANVIKAGGKVLFKRIVADDATLANIIIVATLKKKSVNKTDDAGKPLYTQADGSEGTTVTDNPVMIDSALLSYEASTVDNVNDISDVISAAKDLLVTDITDENAEKIYKYPLFVISDNGRGSSSKRFKITGEYELSKKLSFMFYSIAVLENSEVTESTRFSINPDTSYNGESIELSEVSDTYLNQIKARSLSDNIVLFRAKLSELCGVDVDDLELEDYLFGKTKKKVSIPGIELDIENGIDLTTAVGIGLSGGADGSFDQGTMAEKASADYETKLLEFFKGDFDNEIFNRDTYQIAACFDACYPDKVKRAIEDLAEWRRDFFFYEDTGTSVESIYDAQLAMEKVTPSKFNGVFVTAYDVKDPYSLKQITVSILYSMAPKMVSHLTSYTNAIFAGYVYSAIMDDAIKGTVKFAPKLLPTEDQKSIMEDIRANFASYFKDDLVVETGYTSQTEYTQLSYINNMNAMLRVLRFIRVFFPAIRYAFITSNEDLESYTNKINNGLGQYSGDFDLLEFEYVEDKVMMANKVYKGQIKFRFKDFVQAEVIDAYALPTEISVQ